MMFDGQKDNPVLPDQIKNQVVIQYELAESIVRLKKSFYPVHESLGFHRLDSVGKKKTARLWKAAKGGNEVFKEPIDEPPERQSAFRLKE